MSARRSSSVSRNQASRLLKETVEKAKSDKKKIDETPPPSEWKKAFGEKCRLSEDGKSFELKLHEDADIKRAYEMQQGARTEEIRRGAEMQHRMSRERVSRRDGRVVDFPEELVETAKHKFKGGAGRHGLAPAQFYSMSDVTARYERGPDGLFFKWNGGWEPTNLWRDGALSPQRDPDGNIWVEAEGEWQLTDEVA